MNQEKAEIDITALTSKEARDLEQLESVIQASLNEMESAGKALIEIRDRKLYRAEFGTFRDYVEQKWDMHWRRAYQLCDAAKVVENLNVYNCTQKPTKESQTRELAKLEPEEQVQVWTEAVKTGNTSAKGIAETVEVILPARAERASPAKEPRRKGSFADWQKFRELCIQIEEALDELVDLTVDADRRIPARDMAAKLCRKLEKAINNI